MRRDDRRGAPVVSAYDGINSGMQVAFGFFALGFLFTFAFGVLLGFVDFMRRFLG